MIILGITCEHDAGAALVVDGKLVAAVNEERLTRKKFPVGFPEQSVREVMALAGARPADIDSVSVGSRVHVSNLFWGDRKSLRQRFVENLSYVPFLKPVIGSKTGSGLAAEVLYGLQFFYRREVTSRIKALGIKAPVRFIDHHYSHACSAFFLSGWDDCLVVTLDAQGDGFCSRVYLGEKGCLRLVHSMPFLHSPGYYYMYVTMLAGFKYGQDGKITGLAAYGHPDIARPLFEGRMTFDRNRLSFKNNGFYLEREVGALRRLLGDVRIEDTAAGIQSCVEKIVVEYIAAMADRFGCPSNRLALAGGVFANVKVNKKIAELNSFKEVYIYPQMGDGGLAAGAAMAEASRHGKCVLLRDLYLGRGFGDREVLQALDGRPVKYACIKDIEAETARLIAEKKIVGRFTGRMEYGPRALGNRSILFSPAYTNLAALLNKRLQRDQFMPFAPAVTAGDAHDYLVFEDRKTGRAMEFMTMACDATERCRKEAPSAVHVDGTARPQIVTKDANPSLYKVIENFKELTGTPIVINTSFNRHEEPIVNTPEQAVDLLMTGCIDALAVNNYLAVREAE